MKTPPSRKKKITPAKKPSRTTAKQNGGVSRKPLSPSNNKKVALPNLNQTIKDFIVRYDTDSQIAELILDVRESKVNVLSGAVLEQLSERLKELSAHPVRALLIKSKKRSGFIAGADIHEISAVRKAGTGEELVAKGQAIIEQLATFKAPTIAVIHGHAYGGGLELALACTYRVVTRESVTQLGLPEVTLGILPGFGGTQRLPVLIGLPRALSMLLKGSSISAKQAYRYGLADALIPEAYLPFQLTAFVDRVIKNPHAITQERIRRQRRSPLEKWIVSFFHNTILNRVRKTVLQKTGSAYPAPLRILSVLKETYPATSRGRLTRGLKLERQAFIELFTSKATGYLLGLFAYGTALKNQDLIKPAPWVSPQANKRKNLTRSQPRRKQKTPSGSPSHSHASAPQNGWVIGAGAMGVGIGWFLSHAGMSVRMKDISWKQMQSGYKTLRKLHHTREKKAGQDRQTTFQELARTSFTCDWGPIHGDTLVIEAASEDMKLKKKIFQELEARSATDTILATNTSSLDINEIAQTLKHSERFLGIHFFNPVHRMRLVELAAAPKTDPALFARVGNFLRRHKKIVIPVKACPGFLVNRILFAYLNEALRILDDTKDLETIDKSLLDFGMPMGPFTLIDQVGIDVCAHVGESLNHGLKRSSVGKEFQELTKKNWLGKKSGTGFYDYANPKSPTINPALYQSLYGENMDLKRSFKQEEIVERLIFAMAHEALVCLEEEVVRTHWELDLALLYGTGFPAFRGGLLRYLDSLSLDKALKKFDRLTSFYGERFKPPACLEKTEKKQKTFYTD